MFLYFCQTVEHECSPTDDWRRETVESTADKIFPFKENFFFDFIIVIMIIIINAITNK